MPTCAQSVEARGLCSTHYGRWRRDTLHFYCARCDQSISEPTARFAYEAGVQLTLCNECIEEVGGREEARQMLEAAANGRPVSDGEVSGAMILRLGGVPDEELATVLGDGQPSPEDHQQSPARATPAPVSVEERELVVEGRRSGQVPTIGDLRSELDRLRDEVKGWLN